jgi:hypothetical protein
VELPHLSRIPRRLKGCPVGCYGPGCAIFRLFQVTENSTGGALLCIVRWYRPSPGPSTGAWRFQCCDAQLTYKAYFPESSLSCYPLPTPVYYCPDLARRCSFTWFFLYPDTQRYVRLATKVRRTDTPDVLQVGKLGSADPGECRYLNNTSVDDRRSDLSLTGWRVWHTQPRDWGIGRRRKYL